MIRFNWRNCNGLGKQQDKIRICVYIGSGIGLILHVGGKQPNDQLNPKNKMKTITSLAQVKEIASAMFSKDLAIISVNIETSFGLVAAFRDGSVKMAE